MRVILIKHARPAVDPAAPSHEWRLSDQGREDARRLGERLKSLAIGRVVSSEEPKAVETANEIAGVLNTGCTSAPNLHEHDRSNVPHMRSNDFISHMELFFRKPAERVLGRESADECLARFEDAILAVVRDSGQQLSRSKTGDSSPGIAIVAHGTVIALYAARLGAGKPFELWRRMGLPSYAMLDWDARRVIEVVDRI